MDETVTQAGASLITAGSVAAGTFFGIEYAVLAAIVGFSILGACISHVYIDPMKPLKMALSIGSSFALGVVAGTVGLNAGLSILAHNVPWLVDALSQNKQHTAMLLAFLVSFFAQKYAPIILKNGGTK
jgi:hypothetical protein